ncbi:hypothetical protein D3C79_578800 [compost metagenome]
MFATKDAAHRQRFLVIGNHQGVCIQFGFAAVQQRQGFPLFGHTHHDPAFNAAQVESMHWLTQFQQHVVGNVNHRVNGTDAATTQFLTHP